MRLDMDEFIKIINLAKFCQLFSIFMGGVMLLVGYTVLRSVGNLFLPKKETPKEIYIFDL